MALRQHLDQNSLVGYHEEEENEKEEPMKLHNASGLIGTCNGYSKLPDHPGRTETVRLPLRYGHPLPNINSYSVEWKPQLSEAFTSLPTDHLLRRKTPNGVLDASYDGSFDEWARRPHATKYQTFHLSLREHDLSTNSSAFYPKPAMAAQAVRTKPAEVLLPKLQQLQYQASLEKVSSFNSGNIRHAASLPRIDSLLNQAPNNRTPGFSGYNVDNLQGNLQPATHIPPSPTTSNNEGPYGPYWPNGTFIPYRPAALRDARFPLQSNKLWPLRDTVLPEQDSQHDLLQQIEDSFMQHTDSTVQAQAQQLILPSSGLVAEKIDLPCSSSMKRGIAYHPAGCRSASARDRNQTYQFNYNTQRESRSLKDKIYKRTAVNNLGANRLLTPQIEKDIIQLRERCLAWAHGVYVDLLAFVDQSKRTSQKTWASAGSQVHRLSIYPKPPRKPDIEPVKMLRMSSKANAKDSYQPAISADSPTALKFTCCTDGLNCEATHGNPIPFLMEVKAGRKPPGQEWLSSGSLEDGLSRAQKDFQRNNQNIRRTSGDNSSFSSLDSSAAVEATHNFNVAQALACLSSLCVESNWEWVDGMLLAGCLAYALTNYHKALKLYSKIIKIDCCHVEAISNSAATLLALNRRQEAERYWYQAVNLRPAYFEAVEHLVGLLCGENRGREAIGVIEYIERSLRYGKAEMFPTSSHRSVYSSATNRSASISEVRKESIAENELGRLQKDAITQDSVEPANLGFASSGYAIPGSDNGRMLALIHAKGNMLYALGDNAGAAKAFECAVLIGIGKRIRGIEGLIQLILNVFDHRDITEPQNGDCQPGRACPILLSPDKALLTAVLCFPSNGELPGLKYIAEASLARKAAISTTSNSLLSLAKIYQDGMATCAIRPEGTRCPSFGVREILALYYMSLSLQPSPSTANNVGILLAGVQHVTNTQNLAHISNSNILNIPGVVPGSGIALALMYYNYGLNLDSRHAHLFTNLGSLLKDIGQLSAAIKMYEQAVACDANFDIALANLANAVKDQGRISDAIGYYKRAVSVNPDFAEAVCGLANALNSVCSWNGRGGIANSREKLDPWHVDNRGMLLDGQLSATCSSGWLKRVTDLVDKQIAEGEAWGRGMSDAKIIDSLAQIFYDESIASLISATDYEDARAKIRKWLSKGWEGARLIWMVERGTKRLTWQWYQDLFIYKRRGKSAGYLRPQLPPPITVPSAPTVLPFHTFTYPMNAKQIRQIAQRNGLRISCSTLKAPWLPRTVYPPPSPPQPHLNVGYVSSDFNNHPLAHLMQSIFGMHNLEKVKAFCYATAMSDHSEHRQQIEREAPVFYDASTWSAETLVNQIIQDGIHILVNLNGYTRGARNEIFAARPAPIQMSFMGFAGTLGAQWCDYLLADKTAVPPETLRPWRSNVGLADMMTESHGKEVSNDWIYGENIIYCRDTFFCCDHRQSAPDVQEGQISWREEQKRRLTMRRSLFPDLPDDYIILGNFNQLYKIDPTIFRTWLRILARAPKAVLWLLRFPDLGETHLKRTAQIWSSPDVASRIVFTDVAPKHQHISRARICDLFLDTAECNAHTTAADVLWSGTPLLTLPRHKHKMCSRVAASIVQGALPKSASGRAAVRDLIVSDEGEYEEAAVRLVRDYQYIMEMGVGKVCGRLAEIRRLLFENRWSCPLFDTRRWVHDLEQAYWVAWDRWETGKGGDIWL